VTVDHQMRASVIGSPETVRRGLDGLLRQTGADEIMVTAQIYDHAARLHSFEIVSEVGGTLAVPQSARELTAV
jgi:alkanesulfonate monooxygenase SsuD/methylene tetrahydromethanopterin reductase-like flavin-dependent oxidoreductase (luciferase family)